MNVSGDDFRNLVLKAGYNVMKSQSTKSTAQEVNALVGKLSPTVYGEQLEYLSL